MKQYFIKIASLTMLFCLLFLEVSASVLYTDTFDEDSAFSAYDKNGEKAIVLSLGDLEQPIETSVSVSDTMRITELTFFPLALSEEPIPIFYLSDSAYIGIHRDGAVYVNGTDEVFGAENWVFQWYKLTVAYHSNSVQVFADDRNILTYEGTVSSTGNGFIKPVKTKKENLLLDDITIYELTETQVAYTDYYRNGVPTYNLTKNGFTHGFTVYHTGDGMGDFIFIVAVTDAKGRLLEVKLTPCPEPEGGACVSIECEFSKLPQNGSVFHSFVWTADGLKPVGPAKEYQYN